MALGYIADDEAFQPVVDNETQILLNRAQSLLDSGSLTNEQTTLLLELLEDIDEAETQDELDDLAEELLDALFDLERGDEASSLNVSNCPEITLSF